MMQICPFGVEAYFQNYFKYSWLRVTLRHANSLDWRGLQGYWRLTGFSWEDSIAETTRQSVL